MGNRLNSRHDRWGDRQRDAEAKPMNMNRREAIKAIGGAGMAGAFSPLLFAAETSQAAGREFLPRNKFVIGHRGACAYAPENTLPSYQLALQQGAEFIEQDLQITRDGFVVFGHEVQINRVTNALEVFPDRFKKEVLKGEKVK